MKNLPYTVIIIMNDSTVMNRPPISVTAHKGIDSKNPQLSMAVTISAGKNGLCSRAEACGGHYGADKSLYDIE